MSLRNGRLALRSAASAAALVAIIFAAPALRARAAGPGNPGENDVRALWVIRTTLTSPAAVETMVNAAHAGGFNTLLVQVRGRGDSYFTNGLDPRPVSLAATPVFDPLAETIARAHEAGMRVHAWVNVNLVSSASDLPPAREHVVYRHPEWLMVPRAIAGDLAPLDPKNPEYLGRLARYVRAQPNTLEGLYLSPTDGASQYTADVVRDIVQRYAVDGVHLDYLRYPGGDFDYGRDTLAAFRRGVLADLPTADQRTYDARLAREPFIYTEAFPERWRTFRTDRLTHMLEAVRDAVKQVRPSAILSAAVVPDSIEAAGHFLQDWRSWLDHDLLDVVCPMAYTTDARLFAAQIAADHAVAGRHPLWAGIGAYRLTSAQIVENVQAARRVGVSGIILFSYDSLAEPARGPEYLSQVGRAAFVQ
jgi:uncharacterized lipoprotein YddW (UPF0748 family)